MGRITVAVDDGEARYYMEWSSNVEAPITRGMRLMEFLAHHRAEYGEIGNRLLNDKLDRVNRHGTSCRRPTSFADFIVGNRAGLHETEATEEQIVSHYIRGMPKTAGKSRREDDDA